MRSVWREGATVAAAMAVAVALLALWVVPVHALAPPSNDAAHYLAMARGSLTAAPAPFAYRVGVPWLAHQLPFAPEHTFQAVTLLSLWGTLLLVWGAGRRLGLSPWALALALACALTTPAMTYLFHNLLLTDGAGVLAVTAAMVAWQAGALGAALFAVALGTLARETVVVTAALWLLPPRRVLGALLLLAVGVGLLAFIRTRPGMPVASSTLFLLEDTLTRKGPVKILGDALGTWHLLWLLSGLGLALLPPGQRRAIAAPFALLGLAAAGFSLIALNTLRMFAFLFPALALALAGFFEAARPVARRWSVALVLVLLAGIPLWVPTRTFSALPRSLRAVYGLVLLAVALPLAWRVWRARSLLTDSGRQRVEEEASG